VQLFTVFILARILPTAGKQTIMPRTFTSSLSDLLKKEDQDEMLLMERVKDLLALHKSDQLPDVKSFSLNELFEEFITIDGSFNDQQVIQSDFEAMDVQSVFRRGEFVVIGGRPAMGKSLFMMNVALNMSVRVPVLYVSFDQSRIALTRRMIANLTEIDVEKLRRGRLNDLERKLVQGVQKEFEERKFLINDSSNSSVRKLRDMCSTHIEREGVQVIVIDYLQMLSSERYRHQREMEVAYICRTLKQLARERNVLVIAASQLSRSVEMRGGDKRPMMTDLRESGAIEQDADKVFFVYRPEYYGFHLDEMGNENSGVFELIMAKNRSGHLDTFRFKRNENFTRLMTMADHLNYFRIDKDRLDELNIDVDPF
jgi:replicative DNA helicase